jgi:hypothetical protein
MTVRPWWMGRPYVWTVWASLLCAPALADVRALDDVCPARPAEAPLVRLPAGCAAPWGGVLYTEQEHIGTRTRVARLDAAALAERDRADIAGRALVACRVQRDAVVSECVTGVARIDGMLSTIAGPADIERPALWPWAALAGGLATAGAGVGLLADRGPGEAIGYSVAGLAVGTAVALMVERWGR